MTGHSPAYDDVVGLLLAAGAGRRMGTPKALLTDPDGTPRLAAAVEVLREGGCADVTVVLGARADEARPVAEAAGVEVVVAERWAEGMGQSLRAGLEALEAGPARAALVTLVDLPDVGPEVVRRVLGAWRQAGADDGGSPGALVRATYGGLPGHPVLLGRDHWAPLREQLEGDVGAAAYLAGRRVIGVSCEDLATGRDVDRPEELPGGSR